MRLWVPPGVAARRDVSLTSHGDGVAAVAFSPDGKLVATGGYDGSLRLWNVDANAEGKTLQGKSELVVKSIDFSPDGKRLAAGVGVASLSDRSMGTVVLWDVQKGTEISRWEGHTGEIWTVKYSSNGKYLASGGWDGEARLWDASTGQVRFVVRGLPKDDALNTLLTSVSFSPDDAWLATAASVPLPRMPTGLGEIRIWDVATGKQKTMLARTSMVQQVVFAADGKLLIACVAPDRILFLDSSSGKARAELEGCSPVALSKDGSTIAFRGDGGKVQIVRLKGILKSTE